MVKSLHKGLILSKVSRCIVLLEYKAPYRRYPTVRIPRYYLPQIWMGLDLSPIASFGLYVEVVYRLCKLNQLEPTPNYNKSYQKDTNHGWLSAISWGRLAVLEENDKGTDDGASSPSPVIRPIDFGAAPNDVLYVLMEAIASSTCRVQYLEAWFADG